MRKSGAVEFLYISGTAVDILKHLCMLTFEFFSSVQPIKLWTTPVNPVNLWIVYIMLWIYSFKLWISMTVNKSDNFLFKLVYINMWATIYVKFVNCIHYNVNFISLICEFRLRYYIILKNYRIVFFKTWLILSCEFTSCKRIQ